MRLVSSILLAICVLCSTVQLLRAECSGSYVCKFKDVCGISEDDTRAEPYIIGGRKKSPKQFPWTAQISVVLYGLEIVTGSGTLISDRHVLTAAHLFEVEAFSSIRVYLGTNERIESRWSADGSLEADSFCANRSEQGEARDRAIITLRDPVEFSDYVRPACWTDSQESPMDLCYFAGIGHVDGRGTLTENYNIMQVGEIRCPSRWDNDNYACFLGKNQYDGASTCFGDSGGGLVCLDQESGRWQVRADFIAFILHESNEEKCAKGQISIAVRTKKKLLEACGV